MPDKYSAVKTQIATIYHKNYERYSYRRIMAELSSRKCTVNRKTVQCPIKEMGFICRVRIKKYRSYNGKAGKIALYLLGRNFEAARPNQRLMADMAKFSLFGQKLSLSPLMDLCSMDVISFIIPDRLVLGMVTGMLEKPFAKPLDNAKPSSSRQN